jgi:hypothetical protein
MRARFCQKFMTLFDEDGDEVCKLTRDQALQLAEGIGEFGDVETGDFHVDSD